jgi:hypothetical protein
MNDYAQDPPAKKGLPEGHVPLTRLLSLPILVDGRVAMVIAVANKATDYTDADIRHWSPFSPGPAGLREKTSRGGLEDKRRELPSLPGHVAPRDPDRLRYGGNPLRQSAVSRDVGFRLPGRIQERPAPGTLHPESYVAYLDRKARRKRGETLEGEYEISIVRKDGEKRNLQVFRKDTVWGGRRHYQTLYHDITDRKAAENSLRLSEERYRAFVKQSTEAICLFEISHPPSTSPCRPMNRSISFTVTP